MKNTSLNLLIFRIFLRLGLTSFGGPVAHIGYFYNEFVVKRQWLSKKEFSELVALCHFLPGPASSQVGLAIGLSKNGYVGAFLAWVAFTLPSAILLVIFALGVTYSPSWFDAHIIKGLKIAAVAIVAHAVLGMFKSHCTDKRKITLMVVSCFAVLWLPISYGQWLVITLAALLGYFCFKADEECLEIKIAESGMSKQVTLQAGLCWFVLFLVLLFSALTFPFVFTSDLVNILAIFYRTGASVFGGGHVVLPLLQNQLVDTGLIESSVFISGYGATQAVPGPLFTFAAFLGYFVETIHSPYLTAILALLAIFLPAFFLVFAVMPFWSRVKQKQTIQGMLTGVNVSVVGLLFAALYDALWTTSIQSYSDFCLALFLFFSLLRLKMPSWVIVILSVVLQLIVSLIVGGIKGVH